MNEDLKSLERQLHNEGFLHTYVWQDGPNAHYPDHTHSSETAHIILEGEMTLMQGGSTQTYGAGQRLRRPRRCGAFCADGAARLPLPYR
jgi:hypothetical protein